MSRVARIRRQIAFVFRTWGGKRKGAGRKRKAPRQRVPHRTRPELNGKTPTHLTLRMEDDITWLRRRDQFREIRTSLVRTGHRHDCRIVHFTIQGNHVHLVCEAANKDALARGMMAFKSSCAKRLNKLAGRRGRVFADRYHVRYLESPAQVRNALCYVLNNWRRHGADRGAWWKLDTFSSAAYFDGWRTCPREREPGWGTPVAAPRFWMLTTGWRDYGLIGEREVPGRR